MKRSRNTNYLIPVYICLVLSSHTLGCDECDFAKDYQKCDGNRVMECSDSHNSRWFEIMNCDDFNATCQEGRYDTIDPYGHHRDPNSYGCAVDTISCTGDTDEKCSEDNQFVVGCSYSHGPAAMVIGENTRDYPFCVEKSDGTVGFAFFDGECTEGESICSSQIGIMPCGDGIWNSNGDTCGLNRICEQTTDTDSSISAECVNADPCNEDTGEYAMCKNKSDIYHCIDNETFGWHWSIATCPDDLTCFIIDSGHGICN